MSSSNQTAKLYIADYGGTITTASLQKENDAYTLVKTHSSKDAGSNPSWLTWLTVGKEQSLFALNEGLNEPQGSVSSLAIDHDGNPRLVDTQSTISGPVSSVPLYSEDGRKRLVLAHYGGSAVTNWSIEANGTLKCLQEFTYTLSEPGPVPDRQDAPHPHQALMDPTRSFVLVPDLGADLVRVYRWNSGKLELEEREPLRAPKGSGPRHAVFVMTIEEIYFYLVGELDSTITGYRVGYTSERKGEEREVVAMTFEEVMRCSTFGDEKGPEGNAPAEICVTPDYKYVIASNRMDNLFKTPNADGSERSCDSLAVFAVHDNGRLTSHQLVSAGGQVPRHFSLDRDGTLIAVGLQTNQEVVIMQRDSESGKIGEIVAKLDVGGDVTCVVWDK